MIAIQINAAAFQAEFDKKISLVKNPAVMLLAAGREVGNRLKKHFQEKEMTNANRLGGRRQHFWLAVARTINGAGNTEAPKVSGNTVTVSINDPRFAQKVYGGRIIPKEKQALTIPLTPEAYGKTVQDFPGAFLLKTPKAAYIVKLGENITVTGMISRAKRGEFKGKRASLNFLFKLVPFVDQDADPTALPPKTELEAAILMRAQKVLDNEISEA